MRLRKQISILCVLLLMVVGFNSLFPAMEVKAAESYKVGDIVNFGSRLWDPKLIRT